MQRDNKNSENFRSIYKDLIYWTQAVAGYTEVCLNRDFHSTLLWAELMLRSTSMWRWFWIYPTKSWHGMLSMRMLTFYLYQYTKSYTFILKWCYILFKQYMYCYIKIESVFIHFNLNTVLMLMHETKSMEWPVSIRT